MFLTMRLPLLTFLVSSVLCSDWEKLVARLDELEQKLEQQWNQTEINKDLSERNRADIVTLQSQISSQQEETALEIDGRYGLLITGGAPNGRSVWSSTELFIPATNRSCSLPDLPSGLQGHTSGGNGMMMCGGVDESEKPVSSCVVWSGGEWHTQERRLARKTIYQTAWNLDSSLVLLGGPSYNEGRFGTQVVTGSIRSFRLKHEASNACAIPDDKNSQMFITGGSAQEIVSLYGTSGWVKDIASMNIGRSEHACAGYYTQQGLVLLVTGGQSDQCRETEYCNENGWLTSTEIHSVGESSWRQVAPLQHYLQKPVAVTLDNYIFLTGGRGSGNMKEIQLFKDEKWVSFGEMKDARYYHDVSVIELDDSILSHCS